MGRMAEARKRAQIRKGREGPASEAPPPVAAPKKQTRKSSPAAPKTAGRTEATSFIPVLRTTGLP